MICLYYCLFILYDCLFYILFCLCSNTLTDFCSNDLMILQRVQLNVVYCVFLMYDNIFLTKYCLGCLTRAQDCLV